jgi:hypothetical protein
MGLVKPGGTLALWVYGREGNLLNRCLVEPAKAALVRFLPRKVVWLLALLLTLWMYLPIYTVYLLPLRFLPFYEYFQSWRRLPFRRNTLNVFDKLNAPVTHFISRGEIDEWFAGAPFAEVTVTPWRGVSWSIVATRRPA